MLKWMASVSAPVEKLRRWVRKTLNRNDARSRFVALSDALKPTQSKAERKAERTPE